MRQYYLLGKACCLSSQAYLFIIITLELSRYFEITNMTEYSSKENISRTVTYSSSNQIQQKEDENYTEEMRFNQEGEESTKATIYIRNLGFPLLLIVITLLTVTAFIVLKKRKLNKIVQRLVKYKASIEPHQAYNISIVSHQYYRRPSVAFSEQNTYTRTKNTTPGIA